MGRCVGLGKMREVRVQEGDGAKYKVQNFLLETMKSIRTLLFFQTKSSQLKPGSSLLFLTHPAPQDDLKQLELGKSNHGFPLLFHSK